MAESNLVLVRPDEKPEIGEIRHGHNKLMWQACQDCGKERWVTLKKGRPAHLCCRSCAAKRGTIAIKEKGVLAGNMFNWQGGRHKTSEGYIQVWISKDDFFYPMATKAGYVLEHRLVMAKQLGRCLLRSEIVHHRPDVARDDNRKEVLYLMPNRSSHSRLIPCSHCELKKEIRLLQWQIREQSMQIKLLTSRLMGIEIKR